MRGEYTFKNDLKYFDTPVEVRADGACGPSYQHIVSERSCPKSAARLHLLELDYYDAIRDVAVYRVVGPLSAEK